MPAEGIDGRCTALHLLQVSPLTGTLMPSSSSTLRRTSRGQSRLGQNFLIDRNVARRIVAAASIQPDDEVLEIGPGRGALTRLLVARASRVVAVELDEVLAADLPERLADGSSLTVVCQDALEFDPADHLDGPYTVVANLPYYVATAIVRRFLTVSPKPSEMIVMVQREVADNMTAVPGRMGLLSVMVQLYSSATTLFTVPPRAFRPRPKVASAVVRLRPYLEPSISVGDTDGFIEFVAAGFRAPRKQVHNSLSLGLKTQADTVLASLSSAEIEGSRRPATLSLDEWGALYSAWLGLTEGGDTE